MTGVWLTTSMLEALSFLCIKIVNGSGLFFQIDKENKNMETQFMYPHPQHSFELLPRHDVCLMLDI